MRPTDTDRAPARTLRDQSHRVLHDVKGLGAIAADDLRAGRDRLAERGQALIADGREAVARYQGAAKKYIGEHPWKSLLMAVGVGTLVGLALRRRS